MRRWKPRPRDRLAPPPTLILRCPEVLGRWVSCPWRSRQDARRLWCSPPRSSRTPLVSSSERMSRKGCSLSPKASCSLGAACSGLRFVVLTPSPDDALTAAHPIGSRTDQRTGEDRPGALPSLRDSIFAMAIRCGVSFLFSSFSFAMIASYLFVGSATVYYQFDRQ